MSGRVKKNGSVTSNSPVRVPKTAELVAAQLRDKIVRGELREGDALQPEAQLIEEFGVSRPTMREAFRILEAEQLISVSRGSRGGARVHLPGIEVAARYAGLCMQSRNTTVSDIYQARLVIEPAAARMVAERKRPESIQRLKDCAQRGREELQHPLMYVAIGAEFHRVLVEESGNQTLALLAGMLHGIVEAHMRSVVHGKTANTYSPRLAEKGVRAQEKLIGLIEAGKASEAEQFWLSHMEAASEILLREVGKSTVVDVLG